MQSEWSDLRREQASVYPPRLTRTLFPSAHRQLAGFAHRSRVIRPVARSVLRLAEAVAGSEPPAGHVEASGKRALYDHERQMPSWYGQLWPAYVGLSINGHDLSARTYNGRS